MVDRSRIFSLATCLILLALNVLCLYVISASTHAEQFNLETRVFVLLITITLPIGFIIKTRWVYLTVLAFRLVMLYIVSRTVPAGPVLFLPAFTLSYLVEIGLFLTPTPALAISMPLVVYVVYKFHFSWIGTGSGGWSTEVVWTSRLLPVIFVSASLVLISVSLVAMVHYREEYISALNTQESRNEVITNLMNSNMDLQYFASREGANSAKRERLYITREIHDVVGYSLSNLAMLLNAAGVTEDDEHRISLVDKSKQITEECLQETRKILHRLRAPEIAQQSNLARIRQLATTFEIATGITVEIHFGDFPESLGAEINSAIYRFIQIGLVNSFTHGIAEMVRIIFSTDISHLYVRIWDNGKGIDQDFQMGIGLKGMQERLGVLGGTLTLGNCTDGFEIRATIPRKYLPAKNRGCES